ncbi:MAG: hypothetical protein C0609_08275 [Deltaproteobacteria bacterium]|nr:MAG: hypothetical protein C0609_08275 [Deltaproteobacteria bacterium]
MNRIFPTLLLGAIILPAPYIAYAGPTELFETPNKGVASEAAIEETLSLSLEEAVYLSLKNNRAFIVERYNPAVTRTYEESEKALFDPVLTGEINVSQDEDQHGEVARSGELSLGVEKPFPSGTGISATISGAANEEPINDSVRVGLSVTQQLLRGFGSEVNLTGLRQAELASQASDYELRGYAQSLVADTENNFWDSFLAEEKIAIVEESLTLAKKQLGEAEERIKVGKIPEIEGVAARAEVALRNEDLINAISDLESKRLKLLRSVSSPGGSPWERELELIKPSIEPASEADTIKEHVALAYKLRPELNQARVELRNGELKVVKTKNGLLPKLEGFLLLGKSGYSNTLSGAAGDISGDGYDLTVGVRGELPWENRAARADSMRSLLNRDRAEAAVANLEELAELDVRLALIEVKRLKAQVSATAASRDLQEETLRAETEKFRVGRSTSLLVAGAQRDLLASKIAEIEAQVNYNKALVNLFLQDGSLLNRLGFDAPGAAPPD